MSNPADSEQVFRTTRLGKTDRLRCERLKIWWFGRTVSPAWSARPLMQQSSGMRCMMGGHLYCKSDGLPGWQALWRGMTRLATLVEGYRLGRNRFGGMTRGRYPAARSFGSWHSPQVDRQKRRRPARLTRSRCALVGLLMHRVQKVFIECIPVTQFEQMASSPLLGQWEGTMQNGQFRGRMGVRSMR